MRIPRCSCSVHFIEITLVIRVCLFRKQTIDGCLRMLFVLLGEVKVRPVKVNLISDDATGSSCKTICYKFV